MGWGLLALMVVGQPVVAQYRADAIPASKALSELQAAHGVRLRAVAPLDAEPLIINVSDVKLDDLLAQIAYVTDGKWTVGADGTRTLKPDGVVRKPLQRTRAELQKLLKTKREELAAALRNPLSSNMPLLKKEIDAHVADRTLGQKEWEAKAKVLGQVSPLGIFERQVLLAIPAEEYLRSEGKELYLSTKRNQGEIGLAPSLVVAAKALVLKQVELRGLANASTRPWRPYDENWQWHGMRSAFNESEGFRHLSQRPNEIASVSIRMTGSRLGNRVECSNWPQFLDRSGNEMKPTQPGLELDIALEAAVGTPLQKLFAAHKNAGPAFQLNPDTNRFFLYCMANVMGAHPPDIGSIGERLLTTVDHEPFSLGLPEALEPLQRELGLDIVANLPDTAFELLSWSLAMREKRSLRVISGLAGAGSGVDVELRGSWLTLRNDHELPNSQHRLDRKALHKMMALLQESGTGVPAKALALERAHPHMASSPIVDLYRSATNSPWSRLFGYRGRDRFDWREITDREMARLIRGERIPRNELSSGLASALAKALSRLPTVQSRSVNRTLQNQAEVTRSNPREVPIRFQAGQPLPPSSFVTAELRTSEGVSIRPQKGEEVALNVEVLARELHVDPALILNFEANGASFTYSRRVSGKLILNLDETHFAAFGGGEPVEVGPRVSRYVDLPKSFRDAVQKELDRLKGAESPIREKGFLSAGSK